MSSGEQRGSGRIPRNVATYVRECVTDAVAEQMAAQEDSLLAKLGSLLDSKLGGDSSSAKTRGGPPKTGKRGTPTSKGKEHVLGPFGGRKDYPSDERESDNSDDEEAVEWKSAQDNSEGVESDGSEEDEDPDVKRAREALAAAKRASKKAAKGSKGKERARAPAERGSPSGLGDLAEDPNGKRPHACPMVQQRAEICSGPLAFRRMNRAVRAAGLLRSRSVA